MDTKNSDPNHETEGLPAALIARLRAVDRSSPPPADPDMDAGVLAEARAYFAARRRPARISLAAFRARSAPRRPSERPHRRKSARWAASVAAAAVVVAAFIVVRPLDRLMLDPNDIDRSGRVDILDAFALARMRAAGAAISEGEIERIAARVVALEARGSGQ